MNPALEETQGLRVAVEGCGHGTLHAIYASVGKACEARGWDSVDLLIIGGDFQAVRNAADLTVMSCPVKYREIGDFHAYYSGKVKAPYLTIFIGGNHEASSHLWELFYGGWAAPNIYYMGRANVIRVGGVRIAGLSGIWKGYNYNKSHYERLPYSQDDIKSIYHVREVDTRKLLQLRTQVDIGISHDWPRAIEKCGNEKALYRMKPDFEKESEDGTLGSLAAAYVMNRLRPPHWFAAHLHCRFAAIKTYDDVKQATEVKVADTGPASTTEQLAMKELTEHKVVNGAAAHNADEIELDDDDGEPVTKDRIVSSENPDEITVDDDDDQPEVNIERRSEQETKRTMPIDSGSSAVPADIRAQLPAAFTRKPQAEPVYAHLNEKVPPEISNKVVKFLALDKCLPGRKFLQLLEIHPHHTSEDPVPIQPTNRPRPKLEYDPEWLAITRVFAQDIILGDKNTKPLFKHAEAHYGERIDKEMKWVDKYIVRLDKLEIPANFVITAPPFVEGSPEIVQEGPIEYDNPQTQRFCDLVGIPNIFTATQEERDERMRNGPAPRESRQDGGSGRGGRGGRGGRFDNKPHWRDRGRGRGLGGKGGRGRGW